MNVDGRPWLLAALVSAAVVGGAGWLLFANGRPPVGEEHGGRAAAPSAEERGADLSGSRPIAIDPELAPGAREPEPETPTASASPATRSRFPLYGERILLGDVPLAALDLDRLDRHALHELHRQVRQFATEAERRYLESQVAWQSSLVTYHEAVERFCAAPDSYFLQVPGRGSGLGVRDYYEAPGAVPGDLVELRDISITLLTHPANEEYARGLAEVNQSTREPMGVVRWETRQAGRQRVGFDAAGNEVARYHSAWVGSP
ncbi:MAG TPA: hypothetical protein VJP77_05410 [Planctomycetota bacterium]|nr:hypothetical protein [Planctomycetota bacterium]